MPDANLSEVIAELRRLRDEAARGTWIVGETPDSLTSTCPCCQNIATFHPFGPGETEHNYHTKYVATMHNNLPALLDAANSSAANAGEVERLRGLLRAERNRLRPEWLGVAAVLDYDAATEAMLATITKGTDDANAAG